MGRTHGIIKEMTLSLFIFVRLNELAGCLTAIIVRFAIDSHTNTTEGEEEREREREKVRETGGRNERRKALNRFSSTSLVVALVGPARRKAKQGMRTI